MMAIALSTVLVRAQDKNGFVLHFRINESRIDTLYKTNAAELEKLSELIGQGLIEKVSITVSSSPDGTLRVNEALTVKRAESIRSLITDLYPKGIISMNIIPENWGG